MKVTYLKKMLGLMAVGMVLSVTGCSREEQASVPTAVSTQEEAVENTATEAPAEEPVVPAEEAEEGSESIGSFEDVNTDKVSLIALGNADVPVGQYSQEIFQNLGFWDAIQEKISFGTNVKEVLSQVEEASVDCGAVYATDAATSDQVLVVCEAPEGSINTPVVYPAAILKETTQETAAELFLSYLMTEGALKEFEKVGFSIVAKPMAEEEVYEGGTCIITIFAAASLTESLTVIQEKFMEKYPDIEVVSNFDSSGTLQTQIEEGAQADIFFSAAAKQMNALSEEGYIAEETRTDILENKVVLIVPKK